MTDQQNRCQNCKQVIRYVFNYLTNYGSLQLSQVRMTIVRICCKPMMELIVETENSFTNRKIKLAKQNRENTSFPDIKSPIKTQSDQYITRSGLHVIPNKYTRQIKFSNFRNIRQSLHTMNKKHILEYGPKW